MDAVIGALRVVLGMDSAALEKGWDRVDGKNKDGVRGFKAVGNQISEVGKNIKDSISQAVEGAASRIPVLGDALAGLSGPAAIATGVLAAVAIGAAQAKAAMDWADEMQATADHIGITVESLQSLQYAAAEADVEASDLADGMRSLNGALGAMLTGVGDAKLKKAFEAIGIKREDLKGMRDATDLLPLLASRLSQVGSQAEQVQIARKLGIEKLLPVLQGGADGLASVTSEASKLGLVINNETTASLAELHRKTEVASQRLDTQLRLAFIQLAPAIADGTSALAGFLQKLNEFDKKQMALQRIVYTGRAGQDYEGFYEGQLYEGGAVGAGRGRKGGFVAGRDHTPRKYSEDEEEDSAADRAAKRLQAEMAAAKRKAESEAAAIKSQINSMVAGYATPDEAADLKHAKDMATLTTKYQAEVAELETLKKAGKVTDDEFEKRWSAVLAEYEDLKRRIDEGRDKGYEIGARETFTLGKREAQPDLDTSIYTREQQEDIARMKADMKAAWADIGYAAKNVMRDVIEDGKVNWRSLASYIIENWQSVLKVIQDVWKQAQAGGGSGGGLWGMISGGLNAIINNIPGFADGVNNFGGGLAMVGERGPELLHLPRGASVIPNHALGGFGTGGTLGLAISVMPSPLFDVHIERTAAPMAQQAATQGAAGGMQLSQLDRARESRRTIPDY